MRELKAELRHVDVKRKEPVSLAVSVEPAGGNAKIEVVPDDRQLFAGRRFFVEWRTMRQTEQTPDEWVAAQPRIFPPLLPRHSSLGRWRKAKEHIQSLLTVLEASGQVGIESRLEGVIGSLRQKGPELPGRGLHGGLLRRAGGRPVPDGRPIAGAVRLQLGGFARRRPAFRAGAAPE